MREGLIYTLVFIKNDCKVLLGLKKRGLGKGKWNGFGGKIEKNETLIEGAIRETKEESNLKLENIKHIGVLAYEEHLCSKIDIVHVFTSNKYSDILEESEEMKPQWFDIKDVPFPKMWPDGIYWFESMLKDKYFFAHVVYDNEATHKCCIVDEMDSLSSVLDSLKLLQLNRTAVN